MKYILLVLCVCSFFSCSKKDAVLPGLDLVEWKADKYGCKGYRLNQATVLDKGKDNLFGYSEKQVISVLGVPDETELIDRSEKYYSYYLKGNSRCPVPVDSVRLHLRIRFNSLGYSKEVLVLTEKI